MNVLGKRYLVFSGPDYYPSGGWDDFDAAHDDPQKAIDEAKRMASNGRWSHVIDMTVGLPVWQSDKQKETRPA